VSINLFILESFYGTKKTQEEMVELCFKKKVTPFSKYHIILHSQTIGLIFG